MRRVVVKGKERLCATCRRHCWWVLPSLPS